MFTTPSHTAFGDESYTSAGRYRSVAIATMETARIEHHSQVVQHLLDSCNIREFKWKKLKNAKYRFGAEAIIKWAIDAALEGTLRIDTLVWDTHDSRHAVHGRNDAANLEDMYRFLFKNVFRLRWPNEATWMLYPDENSALDWYREKARLESDSWDLSETGLFSFGLPALIKIFQIKAIQEARSHEQPLCQVADLFAGLAVYSRKSHDTYDQWLNRQQPGLFDDLACRKHLSNSDQERCHILHYFYGKCKQYKLYVSLKTNKGLYTYKPGLPINFWLYQPQHSEDKAPTSGAT